MGEPELPEFILDKETGWSFNGVLEEPGYGYVIGNLVHDGHLCAIQIRIERILASTQYSPGSKGPLTFENFTLGSNRVRRVEGPKLIQLENKATCVWFNHLFPVFLGE